MSLHKKLSSETSTGCFVRGNFRRNLSNTFQTIHCEAAELAKANNFKIVEILANYLHCLSSRSLKFWLYLLFSRSLVIDVNCTINERSISAFVAHVSCVYVLLANFMTRLFDFFLGCGFWKQKQFKSHWIFHETSVIKIFVIYYGLAITFWV